MALPQLTTFILILTVLIVLAPSGTYAFGAGDIPDFSYLNNKAYRHGDIEAIIENLIKSAGGSGLGGGSLLGFASSILTAAAGGARFNKSDVKKIYFGNWLRDYSQAMDIAGLSKLSAETLVLVVSVLGFLTFGFATEEFEINADRLGVYLPVEHIDNPKGYAAKEGDAREYHPKLRPPVEDEELEIDERTGMKKYMATEDGHWDTSTAHIRRTLRECIRLGREAGGRDGPELFDAYRLLGSGLHTLEDFTAHSNWCEIALRKMGYEQVFCHVGDTVAIDTPNGPAPPLVTGTFGGADFLHSLMGEATDKLSQASVTDLTQKMNEASAGDNANVQALKAILAKLPIGGSSNKMEESEAIHAQSQGYNFDPDNVAPPEVQEQLIALLKWRDGVYRDIVAKIEMVPGLADLLEELTNALNAYVFTVIAPYVTPLLQQATGVLDEGSKAVIDSEDQYEVFNNSNASDPSHSLLSKDHFGLILNEPAGQVAQIVVENSVNLIVTAWSNNSEPDGVIDQILEAFHHPYYATGRSNIQRKMFAHMEKWLGGLGTEEAEKIIEALTKESVREGKNKRIGSEPEEPGYGGHSHSHGTAYGSSYGQAGHEETQSSAIRPSYSRNDKTNITYGAPHAQGSSIKSSTTSTYSQDNYGASQGEATSYYNRGTDDNYGETRTERYNSGQRSGNDSRHGTSNTEKVDYPSGQGSFSYGQSQYSPNQTRYPPSQSAYSSHRDDEDHISGGKNYHHRDEDESRGSTQRVYDRKSEQDSDSYGTYGRRKDDDDYGLNHGRQDKPDDDNRGSYVRGASRGSAYGTISYDSSTRRVDGDAEKSDHGYGDKKKSGHKIKSEDEEDDEHGSKKQKDHKKKKHRKDDDEEEEEDEYNTKQKISHSKKSGDEDNTEGTNKYRKKKQEDSGSYGRGNDETYGAGRLNLNDESSDQRRYW